MAHIAYLGTGLLGSAFIEAALGRGESVNVWNRTASKADALVRFGATVAASPKAAVRGAERVHLVLRDDDVVDEVVAALRPGLAADAVIVDHSTTQPALTAARAARLAADGVNYLHCPVFIGPAAARKAQGTILVSGPRALYERVRDGLAQQAARVDYLGDRPDLAAVYKLCGNAFIIGIVGVTADMLSVAAGGGVSLEDALAITELFDLRAVVDGRGKAVIARDYTPMFELSMARKDVRLMLETAGDRRTGALTGMAQLMDALIDEGHGEEDLAAIGREAVR